MMEWFNSRKSAQVAAFFCERHGGAVPLLKLVKLIYLADREFLAEFGFPITNDRHVSMPHGPVNSITYDMMSGGIESEDWSDLIADREGHIVALARETTEDDLDELSDAEIDAMQRVWERFGGMSKFDIRNWTHENCPEWEDPNGSSAPIPVERILRFLGVENADAFAKRIEAGKAFQAALSELEQGIAGRAW